MMVEEGVEDRHHISWVIFTLIGPRLSGREGHAKE